MQLNEYVHNNLFIISLLFLLFSLNISFISPLLSMALSTYGPIIDNLMLSYVSFYGPTEQLPVASVL